MAANATFVWPSLVPRHHLTAAQLSSWTADGYLVIPDAVPPNLLKNAADAIRQFVGADDANKTSWYDNTLDIYGDKTEDGLRPHHGPCGMVNMVHHQSLWEIRQHPRIHSIFADLYNTHKLYVTVDRQHFKAPQDERFPAWSDPGEVHKGLHWDVDTRESNWPIPYALQAVLYLEDTAEEQGALRVVPGFHHRLARWSARQPADRSAERPEGKAAQLLEAEAISIAAKAGSLVVWHSLLPHGPAPNVASRPRISSYVSMLPVDAAEYLGPTRHPDAPLSMSDSGTLAYHESLQTKAYGESKLHDAPPLRRQSRERRIARWHDRLPLLDEDPRENELPVRPPGEEDGEPATLTQLGKKLVGLVEWEEEAPEKVPENVEKSEL